MVGFNLVFIKELSQVLDARKQCVFTLTTGYLTDILGTPINRGVKTTIIDILSRRYKLKVLSQKGNCPGNSTIYYVTDKDILKEWGYTPRQVRYCKEKALKEPESIYAKYD